MPAKSLTCSIEVARPAASSFCQADAPIRPSGAFIWFCHDQRAKLKEAHPDWDVAKVAKRLGKLWGRRTRMTGRWGPAPQHDFR